MSLENQNEFQAELQQELDAENAIIPEMTPAERMERILELAKTIEGQVKDLEDMLNAPAFAFDKDGKMIV